MLDVQLIFQLWRIALCAQNTDVSMKAIQILNTAYFGQGDEFLITCMQSLQVRMLLNFSHHR
jgi:hypothetical protein